MSSRAGVPARHGGERREATMAGRDARPTGRKSALETFLICRNSRDRLETCPSPSLQGTGQGLGALLSAACFGYNRDTASVSELNQKGIEELWVSSMARWHW